MSVLVNKDSKIIVQGFTGSEGTFHAGQMIEYGTNVVGGVTPGKGGQEHLEGIPVADMVKVAHYIKDKDCRLVGPNCPGVITPGEAKGLLQLSVLVEILLFGTTTKEAVELLINDPETECVVMIGEIGGQLEADAAKWYKASGSKKPVIGFIAGETAPAGRTMGHAGAIVGGSDDTAQAKESNHERAWNSCYNGLKVYLGKNEEEPKIQTLIAVRAGSKYDPADNTGLAHYLEHMVFKGTDKIGTQDYAKEEVILKQISDLYEAHKAEQDADKKKEIYKKIDEVSLEASKISIANEYDKMVNSLGAEGTNAFTSNEQTVYVNKIPANELDKWLKVESERFKGQDSDGRKQYFAVLEGLYPNHPYGTQSTIGKSEHLKNPSMEAIHAYFEQYYVPNNMAVIMVGDLDFDKTIAKVNDAFGAYETKEVTHPVFTAEAPITAPIKKEVFGPTAESIYVAFRTKGKGDKQEVIVTLIDYMLANSSAGLIDLNLNQKQMVQNASSFTNFDNDYGFHLLYGTPKQGQTLDEVKDLLLSQIDKVKKGEFEDWLLDAVVNDLRLSKIREYENASSTAYGYLDAFIGFQDWSNRIQMLDEMKKITKQEVVDFANTLYGDNYVAVT
ncbi:Succinate--CoA ligase [ADP-forming] subunit alpha [Nymphon striatum]|nr:Succinate--CoA ligase [ADP-forming] subunit alpha [Nymphon striatum]